MAKTIEVKELESAFHMKPEEIVDFFKSKGLKTSFNWHEVYEDAHAKAFTVAKMTELDLLSDTKKLLERAIEDGESFSTFKKDAKKLFNEKGWTGYKEVKDPATGEVKTVELGTPRRMKLIYDCNMNSAYAVGRYREMLEEIDVAPIWVFKTMADGRERPEHAALHDEAYRADDAFWVVFFPPLGWGCRCYVINLTKYQAKELGMDVKSTEGKIKPATVLVDGKEMPTQSYTFEKAGKIMTLTPDAGWGTNLGVQAWGIDVQAWNKVEGLPEQVKYNFIAKMAENRHNKKSIELLIKETLSREGFKSRGIEKTLTWFTPDIVMALEKNNIKLQTPIATFEDRQVRHSLAPDVKVESQRLSQEQFKNIYEYIKNPDEIYIDTYDAAVVYVKNLPKNEIIDGRDCIKIPVKINSTNKKRPVNYVGTTGRVNKHDTFSDVKRYKKIE